MKGQLTIEYLVSFTVFIGIISYIYLSYSSNIPRFIDEVQKEEVRSKTFQLSELLINDVGKPSNWNNNTVQRIGLSDHYTNRPNLILKTKIDELAKFDCSDNTDYENLLNLFGVDRNFSVSISSIDQNTGARSNLLYCLPSVVSRTDIESKTTRIVAYNDSGTIELAEIIVGMW